jgi:hypothetical protein
MIGGRKSGEVARMLQLPGVYRLLALVSRGAIPAPAKDSANQYLWTDENIEAARQALRIDRRRREHRQPAAASGAA